ncbi:MAG: DUF488 domain-containing protein [Planctomycetota bacterium]|nr:MAG: DUF488 domain-containing protein [Planctomycetota bacterium]
MEICTIGFAKKTAREFFETLRKAGIKNLIDVRLNNQSQFAGFTKQGDLPYLLKEICGAEYFHLPELSPTRDLLDGYKKKEISWEEYKERFIALLKEREAARNVDKNLFMKPCVLLCSEPEADHCHRRLVAEHLTGEWGEGTITHL